MADTTAEDVVKQSRANGWLLDVSRLVSRIGTGPLTGIDRIELAWLDHLLTGQRGVRLLCRTDRGQLLLPGSAGALIRNWARGEMEDLSATRPGLMDRPRGPTLPRHRAHAVLRRKALARSLHSGGPFGILRRRLRRDFPAGAAYLNLGHANLNPRLLFSLGAASARVAMIHDTIPLDHPDLCREGQEAAHRRRLIAALRHADLLLTVSDHVRQGILDWSRRLGLDPPPTVLVAPPGIAPTAPDPASLPPALRDRPYFVAIGTIEPRKNHALLLDAWRIMQADDHPPPFLCIAGRRGWRNEQVFGRLDALPSDAPVIELNDLSDAAVSALMDGAHALLMPSRAEGFGLPPAEAAALGTPVISAPLPAVQEILGDQLHILPADDPAAWAAAIREYARAPRRKVALPELPDWETHFRMVEEKIARLAHDAK